MTATDQNDQAAAAFAELGVVELSRRGHRWVPDEDNVLAEIASERATMRAAGKTVPAASASADPFETFGRLVAATRPAPVPTPAAAGAKNAPAGAPRAAAAVGGNMTALARDWRQQNAATPAASKPATLTEQALAWRQSNPQPATR